MQLKSLRPSPAMGVAVVAVLIAAGGVAYATIPDANGVIHGCYASNAGLLGLLGEKAGEVRVIDTDKGQTCQTGETPLSWNQTGPPGQPGQPGQPGPPGPPGPPGQFAGAVLYESNPVTLVGGDAARDVEADAYCPSGQKAVGGGGNGGANFVTFYNSQPTTNGQNVGTVGQIATGWRVDAHNPTSTSTSVFAYVLCVSQSRTGGGVGRSVKP